jgi:hypothetical protein
MAEVERSWFRRRLSGSDVPRLFCTDEDRDGDFNGSVPDPEIVEQAWSLWREECAFSDQFIAEAPDLGITDPDRRISLREVLVHMVEEYARHNGHADLLRERIDGRVGQ